MKKLVAVTLLIAIILLPACTASRDFAISEEDFVTIMTDEGFAVEGTTNPEDFPMLTKIVTATGDYTAELLYTSNTTEAHDMFNQLRSYAESRRSGPSSISEGNSGGKSSYKLTTDGVYFVVSKVENSILFIEAGAEYKKDINALVKLLEY